MCCYGVLDGCHDVGFPESVNLQYGVHILL